MWFPHAASLCCLSGCLSHIQAGLDDLLIAYVPNFRATWLSTHNFRADETQRHLTWWWGLDCGCHLTARNLASWPQTTHLPCGLVSICFSSFLIHAPHFCLTQRQGDLEENTKLGGLENCWHNHNHTLNELRRTKWQPWKEWPQPLVLLYDDINVTSSSPRPQGDHFSLDGLFSIRWRLWGSQVRETLLSLPSFPQILLTLVPGTFPQKTCLSKIRQFPTQHKLHVY